MHDTINDKYWAFKFSSWTQGGEGGGFSYTRQLINTSNLFVKPNNDTETVDIFVQDDGEGAGIGITRGNDGGIYNPYREGSWNENLSPGGTLWNIDGWDDLTDIFTRDYKTFYSAFGQGGLGNAALASSRRRAPGFALLGEPGEKRTLVLELKSVADIGLIGFPSAGKSSLIAAISAARPKIADYPFTTLAPNLGVVQAGESRFTVADVPGLIPGASTGKGLGLEFLRHIERCAALVHVLDCGALESDRDPIKDFEIIENELKNYSADLSDRPRLIALNKIDLPDGKAIAE